MTEAIIGRWNDVVDRGDAVYHLGDFALTRGVKDVPLVNELLRQLKGTKILVQGNHDRNAVTCSPRWSKVTHYHEFKVDLSGPHKQRIVLFHYALRVWNQSHRGAWMLHGHSHGNLEDIGGKTIDVGVDCHDFTPVSLSAVQEAMENREFTAADHHTQGCSQRTLTPVL